MLLQELLSDASGPDQKSRASETKSATHEGSNLLPIGPTRRLSMKMHQATRPTYYSPELRLYVVAFLNKISIEEVRRKD